MRRAVLVAVVALLAVAATIASESVPCDAEGLEPLLEPGRILLLGEIHGSQEAPAVVAAAACSGLERGLSVAVVLEMPLEEQARTDAFLASDGGPEAKAELLAGEFWQRSYQDGRSSEAMLDLLETLRRLREDGARLTVTLVDRGQPFPSGQGRDDFLGQRIVNAVERAGSGALVLALLGNVHSRTTTGVPWDDTYRPAGLAVERLWPDRTLSIRFTNPPGEAWICTGGEETCGAQRLGGREGGYPGHVEIFEAPKGGYEGTFDLSSLTASPPAVENAVPEH